MAARHTLVFDVGKTRVKLHLLDDQQRTLAAVDRPNQPLTTPFATGPYPAADVDGIWQWLLEQLRDLHQRFGVAAIAISTHGATAALVDAAQSGNGLVLPVLDYEFDGVTDSDQDYAPLRPAFAESGSPDLPAGLNLGRQLFWQSRQFLAEFARCSHILMYPQYWVWRLTGQCWSEVTSLGCHTDLWCPWRRDYSPLVDALGWRHKFPPLANAWDSAGTLRSEVQEYTGLAADCVVHVGLHDSNADYLYFKTAMADQPFALASTGTWSIVMNGWAQADRLRPGLDMLANADAYGTPVICSRFMGGREYAAVCEALPMTRSHAPASECPSSPDSSVLGDGVESRHSHAGAWEREATEGDVAALIENDVFCLPSWQPGTGPFGGQRGTIVGDVPAHIPAVALASLYCALMLDCQFELVDAQEALIVSGAYQHNRLLCGLLAQLRPDQPLLAAAGESGTLLGAGQLARWQQAPAALDLKPVAPTTVPWLAVYRARWRALVAERTSTS